MVEGGRAPRWRLEVGRKENVVEFGGDRLVKNGVRLTARVVSAGIGAKVTPAFECELGATGLCWWRDNTETGSPKGLSRFTGRPFSLTPRTPLW
jgi:hypothetical protein